jgi:Fic family protein
MLIDPILFKRIKEKKKSLDSLRPFPPQALKKLKEQFAIEMTYHSNAIEGNTLTMRETQLIIQDGLTVAGKSLREHLEVINHKEAIDFLENLATKREAIITENLIRQIHFLVLTKINEKEAGKYRSVQVRITGTNYVPPQAFEVAILMKDFVKWLKKNWRKINPIELSALAHFKLVHIHPFIDGNGRTARLLMNFILIQKGYPPAVILKTDRKKYYQVLDQAHKGNLAPLVNFVARSVERSLNLYLQAFEIKTTKKEAKNKQFISLAEAAKGTPYSQEYLSLLARRGKIEAFKLGRNWLTTREAIERYIQNRKRKR